MLLKAFPGHVATASLHTIAFLGTSAKELSDNILGYLLCRLTTNGEVRSRFYSRDQFKLLIKSIFNLSAGLLRSASVVANVTQECCLLRSLQLAS